MWTKRSAIALLLMTIVTASQVTFSSESRAQTQVPFITGGFSQGMVTAVYEASIDIDSKNYGLKPNVMIVNEQGQPIEMGSVMPNSEVKFHLKEGLIDKMMVILPR